MEDKIRRIEDALFWLADEIANLQSHFGMQSGENEGMPRGEFFEANRDAMRKQLCKILGEKFIQ